MKHRLISLAGVAALFLLAMGCEDDTDSQAAAPAALRLTPAAIQFAATQVTTITFTITGGTPSYQWSLNNTNLGWLVSSGDTAIYTSRTNRGQNFIVVTDAASNAVSATITQQ